MDFVVIDIKENKQVPLLLGRPFLATRASLIDVKKGELTLKVGDEVVHDSCHSRVIRNQQNLYPEFLLLS